MMRTSVTKSTTLTFLLIVGVVLFPVEHVNARDGAGDVTRVSGRATLTTPSGDIKPVVKGTRLNSSDIISTSSRSYVRMKLEDSSYIMVRPDSRMKIDDFVYGSKDAEQDRGFFSLLKGGFRAVSGFIKKKSNYRFQTSKATIGIRGTEFSVRVCNFDCYDIDPAPENGLFLEVHDATVILTNNAGSFTIRQGQYAYVRDANTPVVLLDYVPDVFDQKPIPPARPDCQQ